MFVREFGLVHNPSDPERYVRLVKWEGRWSPPRDGYETYYLTPTVWELTALDVSNPRSLNYSGPEFKVVPTVITELPMRHWRTTWPSEAPTETEAMRRERIRVLRRACHVDDALGSLDPWQEEPARAAA